MKIIFIVCFFFCLSLTCQGQDTTELIPDTTQIDLREFTHESLDVYRAKRDFNYGQDPKYEQNFLRRIWMYFLEKLEDVFGEKGSDLFWKIIWYGLAIAGLFYFVYFLLKKESAGMFARSESEIANPGLNLLDANVKEQDFDEWINQAIHKRQFRIAVRLYFLKTLKLLDANDIIKWKKFKTNSDYVQEVQQSPIQDLFKNLIFSYEYAWYGEMEVEENDFSVIQRDFDSFLTQIDKKESK